MRIFTGGYKLGRRLFAQGLTDSQLADVIWQVDLERVRFLLMWSVSRATAWKFLASSAREVAVGKVDTKGLRNKEIAIRIGDFTRTVKITSNICGS